MTDIFPLRPVYESDRRAPAFPVSWSKRTVAACNVSCSNGGTRMRRLSGTLVAALALVPAMAAAQHSMENAKHELGVDLGVLYSKPKGSDGVFSIGTPVDVRIGFV